MEWLSNNWFWVIIFILFIAMHLFGHGHGSHGGHDRGSHDDRKHDHQHAKHESDEHEHTP